MAVRSESTPFRSDSAPLRPDGAPFFSIALPTYGVDRYIADAIADILTQTFGDFELIIVDDCTPDRSVEIAEDLSAHDPRVRTVRHEVNRGLSAARNTAIDAARGSWILFLDPDDRYEPTLLERLHDVLDLVPVLEQGPGLCSTQPGKHTHALGRENAPAATNAMESPHSVEQGPGMCSMGSMEHADAKQMSAAERDCASAELGIEHTLTVGPGCAPTKPDFVEQGPSLEQGPGPCSTAERAHLLEQRPGPCSRRCDLVVFGHVQEYYDASGAFLYENALEIAAGTYRAGAELARAAVTLEQQTHLGYAWNKAYRLDLIREAGLRFEDDVPLVEDILFNVAYLEHVESMVVIPDVLYRYAKRLSGNLTNEFIPRYYELHRRRIREIRDFVASRGALDEQAKATLGALYARFILSSIEQNSSAQAHMNHSMRVTWLEQLFRDELFCELVPCARAQNSTSLAICLGLLNSKNIPALLALGHAIHLVRTRSTTLYTKVKSRR